MIFRYGLLGPSGCGKTTLLSCIVGRLRLDSGEIKLKGKHISDIGYMPQVSNYFIIKSKNDFLTIVLSRYVYIITLLLFLSKELALHNELSIKETFTYYGYIFNLSNDVIEKRGQELKELLKLPSYSLSLNEIRYILILRQTIVQNI